MGGGKTTCPDKDLMTSSDMKFTNQNERGRERERERYHFFCKNHPFQIRLNLQYHIKDKLIPRPKQYLCC